MTAHTSAADGGDAAAVTAALQAALAAEHAAVYGYGVAGAHMNRHRQLAAMRAWLAHRARRDQIIAMLVTRRVRPVAAADVYKLPFPVTSSRTAALLAAAVEDAVTRAYVGLVGLPDAGLRAYGALAMQESAVRAASWRGATVAFPGLSGAALTPRQAPAQGQTAGAEPGQGLDKGGGHDAGPSASDVPWRTS